MFKKHYSRKKSGWLWYTGIYVYISHMHTWIRERREVSICMCLPPWCRRRNVFLRRAMEQRAWALLQLKKPETWGPERCSQLSVHGGPTGQDAGSRFLWATRVELRHRSKVASTLPWNRALPEALQRRMSTAMPFLPSAPYPWPCDAAAARLHSVSVPKCSTSGVCHNGFTHFLGVATEAERFVLSGAPRNRVTRLNLLTGEGIISCA